MKSSNFYNSVAYIDRQSEITRKNWQIGLYDFLRKREKRQCANTECGKWFEVMPADLKRFCSRKCAAKINNPKRTTITPKVKKETINLYLRGLSMQEVAEKMGWGLHKVRYWLDKCNIPRRSPSEAAYAKWNPNGDPFKIKQRLNKSDILLKGIRIGIILGRGR